MLTFIVMKAPLYGGCPVVITPSVCPSAHFMARDKSFLEKTFLNFIHNVWIRQRKSPFDFLIYRLCIVESRCGCPCHANSLPY